MDTLKILEAIKDELDQVFDAFYEEMLSNKDFSVFFRDDNQIQSLIKKQKYAFLNALKMENDELVEFYTKLGEKHYDLRIPFVDFTAGMNILERGILVVVTDHENSKELILVAFKFFRLVRGSTAKGYLNRMLDQDSADIDIYLENVQRSNESETLFATERIIWLKNLIFAIKKENRLVAPQLHIPPETLKNLKASLQENQDLINYVDEVQTRIDLNAANVFYFIEKRNYEEVLTLYRELTNIYKLSLMLTNVMTVATSSAMISDLSKDSLTGLLTRSSIESIFRRELSIAAASGYSISLILGDIDHFKVVNDKYGHLVGDEVLKIIAKFLTTGTRATDFVFRMGGEEFLCLLKGANQKAATQQAENLRNEIEQNHFTIDGNEFRLTMSFGVSTFGAPFTSFTTMYKEADIKLYKSKESGRNKVTSNYLP